MTLADIIVQSLDSIQYINMFLFESDWFCLYIYSGRDSLDGVCDESCLRPTGVLPWAGVSRCAKHNLALHHFSKVLLCTSPVRLIFGSTADRPCG